MYIGNISANNDKISTENILIMLTSVYDKDEVSSEKILFIFSLITFVEA